MGSSMVEGRVLLKAATSRLCVALLALLVASSWLAGSGWLALVAVLTYGAASYARGARPTFRAGLRQKEAERAARLPAPETIRDGAVRVELYAFAQARTELAKLLEPRHGMRADLVRTAESARELERIAAGLARHANDIYTHLERCGLDGVRREVERLADAARFAADPEAAQQYAAACDLRREQLAALQQLQRLRERDLAGLARAVSSLHAARARAVRVRALRGDVGGLGLLELPDELAAIDGELGASEHAAALLEAHAAG